MNFSDKNILIIGASSGIGHALAEQLQAAGATLFVASRQQPAGINATFIEWDVTQPIGTRFDALPEVIHGLVYCPGTINLRPFNRFSADDFKQDFQINVLGAVAVIQATLTRLKKANGGSVVMFSTVAARTGMGFHATIATVKSAVEGLTVSLAAEYANAKIRFNAIAPSLTDTPLAAMLLATDEKRDASNKRHPLGRVGTSQDLANSAAFLLSDDSAWMTGQVLRVDGGMGNLK